MRIEDLTPAERALWNAFPRGESVDLSGEPSAEDSTGVTTTRDPQTGGLAQMVRAEVLVALLAGARQPEPGQVAAVRLSGARITGSLNLGHANVEVPVALTNCVFDEPPHLYWARLQSVHIMQCRLPGLVASGARIDGHLWLEGSQISGGLWLDSARIFGILNLSRGYLSNPGGDALLADRLTVDGNVYCDNGFTADGEVRLAGAHIGGQLIMRSATLRNAGRVALYGSRLNVGANAFCDGGFSAQGEVRLRGARVGGYLSLMGAVLTNPDRAALNADDLKVDTDVFCSDNFSALGKVSFDGAEIGGKLSFENAHLSAKPATDPSALPNVVDPALSLQRIEAEEVLLHTAETMNGVLELQYAKIGLLHDDKSTWPARMQLDGLLYENLHPPLTASERLQWLRRDTDGYAPQPYDRLATTYTLLGLDREAREVLLAKQRDRHAATRSTVQKLWGWIQDITVGYGYKPLRALSWLIAIQIAGTIYFSFDRPAVMNVQDMGHDPRHFPAYDPFLFTLNQLLPVGNFNQQNLFVPKGLALWIADIISALGLILGLTVFAGVARVLSRD